MSAIDQPANTKREMSIARISRIFIGPGTSNFIGTHTIYRAQQMRNVLINSFNLEKIDLEDIVHK